MGDSCKHNEAGCAKQPVSIGVSWLSRARKHNEAGCAKQLVSIGVSWLSRVIEREIHGETNAQVDGEIDGSVRWRRGEHISQSAPRVVRSSPLDRTRNRF